MKLSRWLVILFAALFMITIASCGTTTTTTTVATVNPDIALVADAKGTLILGDTSNVMANLSLPTEGRNGTTITWASSNEAIVSPAGIVTRPVNGDGNIHVTLTATITLNDVQDTKTFDIKVIEADPVVGGTIAGILALAKGTVATLNEATVIGTVPNKGYYVCDTTGCIYVYTGSTPTVSTGDKVFIVSALDIYNNEPELSHPTIQTVLSSGNTLPTPTATTVTAITAYSSTDKTVYAHYVAVRATVTTTTSGTTTTYFLNEGTKKIQVYNGGAALASYVGKLVDINVIIDSYYASGTMWDVSYVGNPGDVSEVIMTPQDKLDAAKAAITLPAQTVAASLTLPATSGEVTVTWTSTDDVTIDHTTGVVTRSTTEDKPVTLTASLSVSDGNGGQATDSKTFDIIVRQDKVWTVAEAIASTTNDLVVVQGVITAWDYNDNFFIQDAAGDGIYVNAGTNLTQTFDGTYAGQTVQVIGNKTVYHTMNQITVRSAGDFTVLDDTTLRPLPVEVTTFTDMAQYEGQFVKLVNVNIGALNTTTHQTLITDQDGNTIVTLWYGQTGIESKTQVDVMGVIYNRDDRPNSIVINSIDDVNVTGSLTDSEKVEVVKGNLTIDATATDLITLPTLDSGVTITWTSSNNDVIDPTTGFVNGLATETVITLTATLEIGDVTSTKTFDVTVSADSRITVAEAFALANAAQVTVKGVVVDTFAKGFFLNDGTGTITVYKTTTNVIGDLVRVVGPISTYAGFQIGSAAVVTLITTDQPVVNAPAATTIAAVNALDPNTVTNFGTFITVQGYLIQIGGAGDYYIVDANGVKFDVYSSSDVTTLATHLNKKVEISVYVYAYVNGMYQVCFPLNSTVTDQTMDSTDQANIAKYSMSFVPVFARENFVLPITSAGSTITWSSDNAAIAVDNATGIATVVRSETTDLNVTLTAEAKDGETSLGTFDYQILVPQAVAAGTIEDLFFSSYLEGSSNNKALEIYNGTSAAIDLSAYSVELYSNGSTSLTASISLTGTLAAGASYVIANSSANATILAIADVTSGVANFNGDDVSILKHSGTIIDSIGLLGVDPGTIWPSTDTTVKTADMTLLRQATVYKGDGNVTDTVDISSEWIATPKDDTTYLGNYAGYLASLS